MSFSIQAGFSSYLVQFDLVNQNNIVGYKNIFSLFYC